MFKHFNGWEMSKKVNGGCKIFVNHFSDSTTSCMEDYITHGRLHYPKQDFKIHCNLNSQSSEFHEKPIRLLMNCVRKGTLT